MGAIGKFNNGFGPNADLACECTQTYHCIKPIFYVMSIILVVQLVNHAPKLTIEQSGSFSRVASECTKIFHTINSFFNFTTIYIYNLVMKASGPRLVEFLNL